MDDVQNGDYENVPNCRVAIFVANEDGRLLFESAELDAHVRDHDANGQEVQQELPEKRDPVRKENVFEVVQQKFIAQVEISRQRNRNIQKENNHVAHVDHLRINPKGPN